MNLHTLHPHQENTYVDDNQISDRRVHAIGCARDRPQQNPSSPLPGS
jgi:hypothetical protein